MSEGKGFLYALLRLVNDVEAVRKGRTGRRIGRRVAGRITGRGMRRFFK